MGGGVVDGKSALYFIFKGEKKIKPNQYLMFNNKHNTSMYV